MEPQEILKKIVGEDTISIQGKYAIGVSCIFVSKLTFFLNDGLQYANKVSRRFPENSSKAYHWFIYGLSVA